MPSGVQGLPRRVGLRRGGGFFPGRRRAQPQRRQHRQTPPPVPFFPQPSACSRHRHALSPIKRGIHCKEFKKKKIGKIPLIHPGGKKTPPGRIFRRAGSQVDRLYGGGRARLKSLRRQTARAGAAYIPASSGRSHSRWQAQFRRACSGESDTQPSRTATVSTSAAVSGKTISPART